MKLLPQVVMNVTGPIMIDSCLMYLNILDADDVSEIQQVYECMLLIAAKIQPQESLNKGKNGSGILDEAIYYRINRVIYKRIP